MDFLSAIIVCYAKGLEIDISKCSFPLRIGLDNIIICYRKRLNNERNDGSTLRQFASKFALIPSHALKRPLQHHCDFRKEEVLRRKTRSCRDPKASPFNPFHEVLANGHRINAAQNR